MKQATTTINVLSGIQDNEDMWYIATSGVSSKNVVVTLSASENTSYYNLDGAATSFINVNTAAPFRGFASQSGNGTSPSVTIASAANDLVFDTACNGTAFTSSGQTNNWMTNYTQFTACGAAAVSTKVGASSVTMSWVTSSDYWTDLAASLEPMPTGVPLTRRVIRLLGGLHLLGGVRLL